jgi:anaerobic selenocysteine-containing dehydrogenase
MVMPRASRNTRALALVSASLGKWGRTGAPTFPGVASAHAMEVRPSAQYVRLRLNNVTMPAVGQREQARVALATAMEMSRTMEMTFWLPQPEAALAQVDTG